MSPPPRPLTPCTPPPPLPRAFLARAGRVGATPPPPLLLRQRRRRAAAASQARASCPTPSSSSCSACWRTASANDRCAAGDKARWWLEWRFLWSTPKPLRMPSPCTRLPAQVIEAGDRSLTGVGATSPSAPPLSMLSRLHLLFFNMFRCGAAFSGDAGGRLIRAVARKMKQDVDLAERAEKQVAVTTAAEQARRVQSVLAESLVL